MHIFFFWDCRSDQIVFGRLVTLVGPSIWSLWQYRCPHFFEFTYWHNKYIDIWLTFRLNRVNLAWQISQNMVDSWLSVGLTVLECFGPQNPALPIEVPQLVDAEPLPRINWNIFKKLLRWLRFSSNQLGGSPMQCNLFWVLSLDFFFF